MLNFVKVYIIYIWIYWHREGIIDSLFDIRWGLPRVLVYLCDDDVTVYGLTGGGVEESMPPPSPIGSEQLMVVTSRRAGRCETSRPRARRRRRRSVIPHMHRHALLLATPATAAAASVVAFRFHRYRIIRQRRDHNDDCPRMTLTVSAAVRVSPHSES